MACLHSTCNFTAHCNKNLHFKCQQLYTYVIIVTRNQYFLLIVLCLLTQTPFCSQVITEVTLTILDLSTIHLQLKIVIWRWREGGRWVGVNSCLVGLITTESVSITFLWLLLPPEVGVNRHGQSKYEDTLKEKKRAKKKRGRPVALGEDLEQQLQA